MKEYNRKTKSWEYPADTVTSLKKKETCRGKRPHEYQLVLPPYVCTWRDLTSDEVLSYYVLEEKCYAQDFEHYENMQRLGVSVGKPYRSTSRHFECKVCGKKEMELIEVKK